MSEPTIVRDETLCSICEQPMTDRELENACLLIAGPAHWQCCPVCEPHRDNEGAA